ncbi:MULTISPECIES: ATPase [Pseudomonas]|uniref:ATPase n=1 Tax=Pseudomonas TaxID=286 RepID=UPI00159688EE|nr:MULTISPECIES: ATPase [Pseudomonas]
MKTGMLAALLALFAALGGCAAPAGQQAAQPYGHFYSATAISSVALAPGQHVAVLLGRNADSTLSYLQQHRDEAVAKAQPRSIPVATLSAGSQAYDWLAHSLAQQFAEVTFYEDLDSLLADHPDVIVLLDSESRLATADVESRVVARFFDSQLTYIGRAEGRAHKDVSNVARMLEDEQAAKADALRDFDASLQRLLGSKV